MVELFPGNSRQSGLQLGQFACLDGKAGCGRVPTVFDQERLALVKGVGDMEFGDTAAGANGYVVTYLGYNGRAIVVLHQTAGDQADDTGGKVPVGCKE